MNLFDLCVYKNLNKGSGGDVDVSSLVATENKTYNAGEGKAYNPVVVNVPTPPPSLQSLNASHNGYFLPSSGYVGFDEVTVDVATPLETLSATENGTYTPSSGYEGFSEVTVNVPLPNNAYLLESQSGDVVTIQHGAEFDMPKLIASIEPQQSGSGDPSPENVRPISGWTACNVVRTGKNLFDINSCEIGYLDENGAFVPYSGFYCTPYLNIKPNITYSLAYNRINTSSGSGMRIAWYDKNKTFIRRDGGIESSTSGEKIITATAPSNAYYCRCSLVGLQEKYILAIGTITDLSSYTPYDSNSHTYTINFVDGSSPLTVYGGTLDVLSGLLTITDGYISSYNGETLPSTWISDRDVYAEGTTPTTGAEVCYKLETPQTYQLTPTQVKSLLGVNSIYADTGEVDVQIWTKEVTS